MRGPLTDGTKNVLRLRRNASVDINGSTGRGGGGQVWAAILRQNILPKEQATKARRGRCIALLFQWGWVSTPRPRRLYPPGMKRDPLYRGADKSLARPGRTQADISVRMA